MTKDEEHLNLLAIFHYIVGGIGCLFACIPLFHVGIGAMMLFSPDTFQAAHGQGPPVFFGYMFLGLGLLFFLVGQAISICIIYSGRCLAKRTKYMFSFVTGCIQCMFVPFGTVLGIFTIIVLSRDSTKTLYNIPEVL